MNSDLRGEDAIHQRYLRQSTVRPTTQLRKRPPEYLECVWSPESVWVPLVLTILGFHSDYPFPLTYSFLPLIPLVILEPSLFSLLLVWLADILSLLCAGYMGQYLSNLMLLFYHLHVWASTQFKNSIFQNGVCWATHAPHFSETLWVHFQIITI